MTKTWAGVAKHPIMTIIIVAMIVSSFLLFTDTGRSITDDILRDDGDNDNPQAIMTMYIEPVGNPDAAFVGTFNLEELALFQKPTTLTTFNKDVFGIDNNREYNIYFIADVSVLPETPFNGSDDVVLDTTFFIEGHLRTIMDLERLDNDNFNRAYIYKAQAWSNTNVSVSNNMHFGEPTSFDFSSLGNRFDGVQAQHYDPNDPSIVGNVALPIYGYLIDGSEFHISVYVRDVTTNGATYYGFTTADIILTVDLDGNLVVSVDNVIGLANEGA